MLTEKNTIKILSTTIAPISIKDIITLIIERIKISQKGYITVTGVHGIIESYRSPRVRYAHQKSLLTVPDGMPLVYIGKLAGFKSIKRCYGPDLMAAMIEATADGSISHFFYGGKKGVADSLKEVFESKFPGIKIMGTYTPPFRSLNKEEENELNEILKKLKPDIMWVGLSTPKQELFMYEYIDKLPVKIMVGVGAAFDIHTGSISSAPRIMQVLALEWLYRLVQEPKRLWRRYLINNPLFIYYFLLQILRVKRYD